MVFFVLVVLGLLGISLLSYAGWHILLGVGLGLIATGLLIGLPAGALYHVALRRALLGHGTLPARWWVRPTLYHEFLAGRSGARTLFWFYAGAAGFLITIAGLAFVAIGALRAPS